MWWKQLTQSLRSGLCRSVALLQGSSQSIDVNEIILRRKVRSFFIHVIIYTYYLMRLLGLALRRRLTESAIIRIFAKI